MTIDLRDPFNRREFLKRAAALGLSASGAAALLEACGGRQHLPLLAVK